MTHIPDNTLKRIAAEKTPAVATLTDAEFAQLRKLISADVESEELNEKSAEIDRLNAKIGELEAENSAWQGDAECRLVRIEAQDAEIATLKQRIEDAELILWTIYNGGVVASVCNIDNHVESLPFDLNKEIPYLDDEGREILKAAKEGQLNDG